MDAISVYVTSRAFCVWRWIYTLVVLCFTIGILLSPSPDWGMYIGWYNLAFGAIPCAVFLLLWHVHSRWVVWFAYVYDAFVVAVLLLSPMMIGYVFPLTGFICEWVFLTVVLVRGRFRTRSGVSGN